MPTTRARGPVVVRVTSRHLPRPCSVSLDEWSRDDFVRYLPPPPSCRLLRERSKNRGLPSNSRVSIKVNYIHSASFDYTARVVSVLAWVQQFIKPTLVVFFLVYTQGPMGGDHALQSSEAVLAFDLIAGCP